MLLMKKFIVPFVLLAMAGTANAQTKRIAHRSHSGADRHFTLSGSDNFGNPPEDWRTRTVPIKDTAKAGTEALKPAGTPKDKKAAKRKKKRKAKDPK